jgi:hypothetical protein
MSSDRLSPWMTMCSVTCSVRATRLTEWRMNLWQSYCADRHGCGVNRDEPNPFTEQTVASTQCDISLCCSGSSLYCCFWSLELYLHPAWSEQWSTAGAHPSACAGSTSRSPICKRRDTFSANWRHTAISRGWRILALVYDIQNYWVCGLCPSSGIIITREHNVIEVSCFEGSQQSRCPLTWGQEQIQIFTLALSEEPNRVGFSLPSPEDGNRSSDWG